MRTAENGSAQYHCFGCQEKFAPCAAKLHLNLFPVSKCVCELEVSTLCFFMALTRGRTWKFRSRTQYPIPVMQAVQVKAIQKSCCCNLACHWRACSSWVWLLVQLWVQRQPYHISLLPSQLGTMLLLSQFWYTTKRRSCHFVYLGNGDKEEGQGRNTELSALLDL